MKVTCELTLGNNQTHEGTVILLQGDPFQKSGFVYLVINDKEYELRPSELIAALDRVRSDRA